MKIHLRRAAVRDVKQIKGLLDYWSKRERLLPRSLNDLYGQVRDFWVCEGAKGIVGCAALHVGWEDLGEVRSLVVARRHTRKGTGQRLLDACIEDARLLGIRKVMALTYVPEFFEQRGFRRIDKGKLPHKIWHDCIHCPKFPDCDETALMLVMGGKRST